jgi:DNA-binding NarL/FixJ family response regulator
MTRVAVLDRHPAVRAGLHALLQAQPGFASAGCAGGASELLPLLYRADPDILVLDEPALVRRVKTEAPRTRVVLYLPEPAPETLLAAAIAGADGVVDKAAEPRELLAALRAVARGERLLPSVPLRLRARAAARLDPRDRPIFAMRLAGTSPRDIANVVGMTVAALNARVQAIVAQLSVAPAPA